MTPSPPYVSAMLAVHNTNNITTIWEFNTDTGGKGGNNVIWSQSRIYLDHFFLSRIVDNNQAMTYFEYRISKCYIFLFIFLLFFLSSGISRVSKKFRRWWRHCIWFINLSISWLPWGLYNLFLYHYKFNLFIPVVNQLLISC